MSRKSNTYAYLLLQIALIASKHPIRFFKNLNLGNIQKLLIAIDSEDPSVIILNVRNYLGNDTTFVGPKISPYNLKLKTILESSDDAETKRYALFISHEATLTGAPLIVLQVARDLNEVHGVSPIFVLLKGGKISTSFTSEFPTYTLNDQLSPKMKEEQLLAFLELALYKLSPQFALVNSAESRFVLSLLRKIKIPKVIALIHELGNLYPKNSWWSISNYSDLVVFPSEFVRNKALENTKFSFESTYVRGQGLLKPEIFSANHVECRQAIREELGIEQNAKIVLSCGTPIARKGIDIFVFTAISCLSKWKDEENPLYFIWLGDAPYNYYQEVTQKDIENSLFSHNIRFIGSREDTIPWFSGSDLFFLTSRGDPFPCVVHEALAAGLEVVGFQNTGGLPEMIESVIHSYGDIAAASEDINLRLTSLNHRRRQEIIEKAKQELNFIDYSNFLYSLIEKMNGSNETYLEKEKALMLPVPPPELMTYGEAEEQHLIFGKREYDNMLEVLSTNGYDPNQFKNILEFGCANCRILRWFIEDQQERILWGIDLNKTAINWVIDNLGDVINASVCDRLPPLKFRGHNFDFIFACSVFTHIGEHAGAWLDELVRVMTPGGLIYITFIDEYSTEKLKNESYRPVYKRIATLPNAEEIWNGNFKKVIISPNSAARTSGELVIYHSGEIHEMSHQLELIHVQKHAYAGFQSAYLFRKK